MTLLTDQTSQVGKTVRFVLFILFRPSNHVKTCFTEQFFIPTLHALDYWVNLTVI